MDEEKKMDEKALEGVSGGTADEWEWTREEWSFICNNCIGCKYDGPQTCPYGTDRHQAIIKAGGTKCAKREAPVRTV